ncbi:MAG: efflux RND transporter periplasmic adaptor subunit [Deltaproteobacteria bacterium]|nr:efflux RND transporter periplasmic adaptor subunit [Deltaproteobacteria bacterium]
MKKHFRYFFLCLLIAGSMLAAYSYGHRQVENTDSVQRKLLCYIDPMNPANRSETPGIAPCGMPMEPVYADEGPAGQANENNLAGLPPGTIHIHPDKQQLIGVKTGIVEKAAWHHTVRVMGRIAPDEDRFYRLNASTELWIRKIFGPTSGSQVKKNDRLLAYYSTNFLSAAASYTYALDTLDRQRATGMKNPDQDTATNLQVRQAVESLQNIGVSDRQIEEMAKTRNIGDLVEVRSPTDGIILARTATLGMWVGPGTELYRIADLSHVWIFADIFENEAALFTPGKPVRVIQPAMHKSFTAIVSSVLPLFDPATKTLKIRLEADNPGYSLRPDMLVDVEFPITLSPMITVPLDAILDSGLKKTVFIDIGNGFFEPRHIETGRSLGERVEILQGLTPGEKIVVSGKFLIDSEARMQQPDAGMNQQSMNATNSGYTHD